MNVRCSLAVAMAAALGVAPLAAPARAEIPSVVRARYGAEQGLARGTVFFLETVAGPVAVGAAHSFELSKLAASPDVVFELGHTRAEIATTTRLLTPLGTGYGEAGGSLRSDFVVFALDAPPALVHVLRAGEGEASARVDVFGIPGSLGKDQDTVAGRVREADGEKLEIELDVPYDLRGWGGAPIVARDDGSVIGIVQAAQPSGRKMRVLATPIAAVLDGLRIPLEGGRGRDFAAVAEPSATAEANAPRPGIDAKSSMAPVLQTGPQLPLQLGIEYPPNETILGGTQAMTFIAGRALAQQSAGLKTDVIFVVDVSSSTRDPSGVDVNGNGIVGSGPTGEAKGLYGLGSVDAGDSVFAAELAAVRRLCARLDPRYTRIAIATFAGRVLSYGVIEDDPALTWIGLTNDYEAVYRALDRVVAPAADGMTHMAAGVDQATRELLGLPGALSIADPQSQKIAIFITDGQPSLPFGIDRILDNTVVVLGAAKRAAQAGVRVFTYGVGDLALQFPLALVELAQLTGGVFTPLRDPARLSDVFAAVNMAGVEELAIRNATIGEAAQVVDVGADGSFGAFVLLRAGRNIIEVTARASGGRSTTERVTVHFAPDAPTAAIPPALLPLQSKLLELRLTELRRERIAGERQRDEQTRKQLVIEIERERGKAADRAEQQRKRLEIEIERQPSNDGAASPRPQHGPATP